MLKSVVLTCAVRDLHRHMLYKAIAVTLYWLENQRGQRRKWSLTKTVLAGKEAEGLARKF